MIDEKVLVVVVFALLCEETGEFLDSKSTYPPPLHMHICSGYWTNLEFYIHFSPKSSWKWGRKTKLILGSILYYSDVVEKVDN